MLSSVTFQIIGDRRLACESCEHRVQELLQALPGIKQVRAQARDQSIGVLFEATITAPDAIAKRLAEAGYELMAADSSTGRNSAEQPGKTRTDRSGSLGGVTSLLASAVGVISSVGMICPACVPAIATLLASLGIGVAVTQQFIQPLMIFLLAAAVAALAWSAKLHRHWWIVLTGVAGGILVYVGRSFWLAEFWMNQTALWAGTGLLIGTSIVNLLLKRACSKCQKSATSP
jgi:copper chaperone CopZ